MVSLHINDYVRPMNKENYIAQTRFGLGVNPSHSVAGDAKRWLKQGLTAPDLSHVKGARASGELAKQYRMRRDNGDDKKAMKASSPGTLMIEAVTESADNAVRATPSINWRILDFFSNHFSVTGQNAVMKFLAPSLEKEAIAPNLFGRFEDMLMAVTRHPAMLAYLDNAQSIGPNSRIGKRRDKGLNENLAREILELHTLGVNSGYQQQDVLELAKAITGFSIARKDSEGDEQGFVFRSAIHEPGDRVVLGKRYRQKGEAQGLAILKDLARDQRCADFVCKKIATHFISDTPSTDAVKALSKVWIHTKGDLKAVFEALIDLEESWHSEPQKFKSPREFYLSAMRAATLPSDNPKRFAKALRELGQLPFSAGSPAGFDDTADAWLSPSSMVARADFSQQFARLWRRDVKNVETLLDQLFGDQLSNHSRQIILRAGSKQQSLALLLMSPEFLRR